jgi:hypothetical protein
MMKKALQSAGRKFDKQAVPYCSASAESRRQSTAAILGQMAVLTPGSMAVPAVRD